MLGIWHKGDWLKIDLAQPIYGQVEHGSPIPSWFLYLLIRILSLGILSVNVIVHMWHLWLFYPRYLCYLYIG